ncbi:MAG: molybdenum cofactor guanylyltransferase [Lachnospiraceae bacterium]|nr:molybdenum cofactor guanylyltransferase [Lachnospiraceae bacterium]
MEHSVGLVILSGGRSRRMGQQKELLDFRGETFLARICRELSPFCAEKYLSVHAGQDYAFEGYETLYDLQEDIGPMGGICTALSRCDAEALLAVACDMPFYGLKQAYLTREAWDDDTDILLPVADGREQMLSAVYAKRCLAVMEEMIAAGDYRLRTLTERVRTRRFSSPDAQPYRNINTMREYAEVRKA